MDAHSLDAESGAGAPLEELLAHSGWISALARRLIADPLGAEDLVQETWTAVLARRARPVGDVRAWLAAVMRNLVRDRARSEGARRRREERTGRERASGGELPTPDELAEALEGQKLLVEALRELGEPYRATILLHYHEGLSSAEIARRQATPEGTVRWRLKHGLDELRTRLDARTGGERRRWGLLLAPLARRHEAVAAGGATALVALLLSMKPLIVAVLALCSILWFQLGARGVGPAEAVLAVKPPEAVTHEPLPVFAEARLSTSVLPERTSLGDSSGAEALPDVAHVRTRVLDPAGRPIASARLWSRVGGLLGDEFVAVSDAAGTCQLELELASRERLRFELRAHGFATMRTEAEVAPGAAVELGELVLQFGGSVSGRVLDDAGEPLQGADVWTFDQDQPLDELGEVLAFVHPRPNDLCTMSDARGEFRLDGVPAGWARVAARTSGRMPEVSGAIDVRAGHLAEGVTLTLHPIDRERIFAGRVVTPSGEPAVGVSVRYHMRSRTNTSSGSVPSDAEGRFQLPARKGGEWRVFACDDAQRFNGSALAEARTGDSEVVLALRPRRPQMLLVRDEEGALIVGAGAWVRGPDATSLCYGAKRLGDGTLEIVPPTDEFGLDVHAEGFERVALERLMPGGVPGEVVLRRAPSLTGRVLVRGEPLAGATLEAFPAALHAIEHDGFPVHLEPRSIGRATSAADGSFTLPLTFRGELWLRASAPGLAPAELGPLSATGGSLRGLELVLDEGGALEGRVRLRRGSPAGVIVGVSCGDGSAHSVRADAEGRYRFEGLRAGSWHVRRLETELSPDGHSTSEDHDESPREIPSDCVVLTGRTTWFDLDLGGAASECELVGTLLLDGAGEAGWSGELLDPAGKEAPIALRLDAHGSFRVDVPLPGKRRLLLTASAGPHAGLRILDELTLDDGANAWQLTLQLGNVETLGLTDEPTRARPVLVVELDEGRLAVRPARSNGLELVPAGRVSLRWTSDTEDPRLWPKVREGVLAPGGVLTLRP
ncbi:MAG: sigma-70 family RNA polymerase sigma factor [Planctomycetota bacterium]